MVSGDLASLVSESAHLSTVPPLCEQTSEVQESPGAAETQCHKAGGLNSRNICFHSSGGWLSAVRVSAGWFLLRSRRGHRFQASS